MELEITAVYAAFTQYSGESPDPEGSQREALCAALCSQCAHQVECQLRPGLTEEQLAPWQEALVQLAAVEAFYQLLLTDEAVSPQSLTAGDLRLTQGEGSRKAAQLAEEKRRAASPVLWEEGFYFGTVRKEEENVSAQ
ncbi:MAG: hypothetical protein ACOYJZ_06670 [Acutalibacter sp.]|jgi:hypothetical protein